VDRTLRRLIRTAASCRDLDVCLAVFDAEVALRLPGSPEIGLLRRRLRAARSRTRHRMTEALLDQELSRLRRDLRLIVTRGSEDLPVVRLRIEWARELASAETLSALGELADRFDPDRLHWLRRRIRRLRYATEAVSELGEKEPGVAKRLRRLQEGLGRVHDAHVLAIWLGAQAELAERRERGALAAEARHLQAVLLEQSRAGHRAYREQDPGGVLRMLSVTNGHPAPVEASPVP